MTHHDSPLIWIAAVVAVPILAWSCYAFSMWLFGADDATLRDDSTRDADGASNEPTNPFIF